MPELTYKKIAAVLERARHIDQKCLLFGASKHQYRLNPPVNESTVRAVETRYGIQFPEDYFRFITGIANGGAGPDYGIMSLEDSLMTNACEDYREAYLRSLKNPFIPRQMANDEIDNHAFSRADREQNSKKYFVYEKSEDEICDTDVFLFWAPMDASGILVL